MNRKKLYVHLHARLGNQLFQMASAIGLAKRHDRDLIRVHYPPDFDPYIDRHFAQYPRVDHDDPILRNIQIYWDGPNSQNNGFIYNDRVIENDADIFLTGYLQHEGFFKNCKPKIRRLFANNHICSKLQRQYDFKNSHFIHVRRGDYVNLPEWQINYDEYFKSAIRYILDRRPNAHFFIISDDIDYCKTYLPFREIRKTFVENMGRIETLYFMSLCNQGGICSNSTYSWWGSWLISNPNKIVVMPREWIKIDKPIDIWFEGSVVL